MINPRVPGQRGLDDGEADGGGGGAGAGEAAARGDQGAATPDGARSRVAATAAGPGEIILTALLDHHFYFVEACIFNSFTLCWEVTFKHLNG